MENLEEFKNQFEAGKVSEWDFYSTLVREFGESLNKVLDLPFGKYINLDKLNFENRFVCLTGEEEPQKCQLLIDIDTGHIYSPKWYCDNLETFQTQEEFFEFAKKQNILELSEWEIEKWERFKNFPTNKRRKFFSKSDKEHYNYTFLDIENDYDESYKSYARCLDTNNIRTNYSIESYKTYPFIVSKNSYKNLISDLKYLLEVLPILQELQKSQKIQLHKNLIDFPNSLFQQVSEVSKHQNLISYIDFLLWKIENYSVKNSSDLGKSNELYLKLSNLKSEIEELNRIKNYLFQKFDFSLENLKTKLLEFKNESINHLEILDSQNSIWDFEPQPKSFNFELLGETITRLYNNQISKVSSFSDEVDFLLQLSEKVENLFRNSHNFLTGQRESLRQSCEKEYVGDEFEKLFSEWSSEIEGLESRYFPLIQAYFNGSLSKDTTIHTLTLFEDYRKSIDSFFESERISLIQKYDENPKSQFLQKIEMENHIFKTCCSVRGALKDVISKEEQQITKKLLNSQSETLLSRQLSNLIEFSKEAGVSELIHNEFLKLQGENLEIYLSDVEKYSEELQKRDKEIQGLMFKMKKDLEQQKVKEQ
jgi:hypothetical protein